jgi:group I intron endonuclease
MADRDIARKVAGIYVIRNSENGQVYVGSSQDIYDRWNTHRLLLRRGKHHAPLLQMSWSKYGEAVFLFEIIEAVVERAALLVREQYWIDTLKSYGFGLGFNGRPLAASPKGTKSPAVAAANAARVWAPETLAKMSAARTGKKRAPETAALMRVILELRNKTEEMRATTALRNKSPEMRAAASRGLKGKPKSPEYAAMIRDIHARAPAVVRKVYNRKPRSPEHEAKLRLLVIERNKSPESRARSSERMRANWARWKDKQP